MFSVPHLIIIFVVVLIVFGPEKLPDLARNLGKIMGEFRRATGDLRSSFDEHMRDIEREASMRAAAAAGTGTTIAATEQNTSGQPQIASAEGTVTADAPRGWTMAPPNPSAGENAATSATETADATQAEAANTNCPAEKIRQQQPAIPQAQPERHKQKRRRLASIQTTNAPGSQPKLTRARGAMAEAAQPERSATPTPDSDPGGRMSFFEHLVELRKRLIYAAVAIVIGTGFGLLLSKHFITFIVQPMHMALKSAHLEDNLYYTSPAGYVSLVISLGLYLGIALAMPFVLYQIWLFVAPGLFKHERSAVAGFIISSMFLFLCGLAFGYFVMLPTTLKFLIGFANEGPIKPLISINEYFDLTLVILLGLGIVFELPVLIFILSLFGIVTPKFLLRNFRYAMLIITVVAAIVTPTPDATTMLVFMAPMILLYFVGVLVSYVVLRRKQATDVAAGEAH